MDDDELLREMFVLALQPEGYHIVQAENGTEAVRAIEQDPAPAVVVLDLMLPDMDGLQVLRYLHEHGVTIPVVAMSASPTLLGQAVREGAPAALAKPFDLHQMLALVASYCPPPQR